MGFLGHKSRREREWEEVRASAQEDLVALGDDIRSLDVDIEMPAVTDEAKQWILENQAGRPSFLAMRRANAQHQIESVGRELRAMMPWLNPTQKKAEAAESKQS